MNRRLFLLLFFSFVFISFSFAQPSRKWQKRLNGEWIANDGFSLSFWDGSANYQTRYSYQTFEVRKDTLVLKSNAADLPNWKGEIKLLLVDRWNRDSMKIQVVQHPYEPSGSEKMVYRNTSIDRSLLKWDSVLYTSHPCFGNCENFRLKFWPNGMVEYWGVYKSNPLGYFMFELNHYELKRFNQLLQSSQFKLQPAIWDLPQDLYAQTVEFYGPSGKVLRAHADNFSPEFNWLCAYFQNLKKEKSRFFFRDE
jgi:hypothetical protein